uniref:Uncharacterized protein n=1 Tax=Cacopsylla melanoneura TaxID=428564 RepID=A0A8D8ZI22_9HEMI
MAIQNKARHNYVYTILSTIYPYRCHNHLYNDHMIVYNRLRKFPLHMVLHICLLGNQGNRYSHRMGYTRSFFYILYLNLSIVWNISDHKNFSHRPFHRRPL